MIPDHALRDQKLKYQRCGDIADAKQEMHIVQAHRRLRMYINHQGAAGSILYPHCNPEQTVQQRHHCKRRNKGKSEHGSTGKQQCCQHRSMLFDSARHKHHQDNSSNRKAFCSIRGSPCEDAVRLYFSIKLDRKKPCVAPPYASVNIESSNIAV